MKKIISLLLALIIASSMIMYASLPVSADMAFTDVNSSQWFYSDVSYVMENGIMKGTSGTTFSPDVPLTRVMSVTLLYRMAAPKSVPSVKFPFKDVKKGQWYTDAVKWAYSEGIIKGKTETHFGIEDNITRAEFAVMVANYAKSQNIILPRLRGLHLRDMDEVPSWAYDAVKEMFCAQIFFGKEGLHFCPDDNVTRAEAAAVIHRFIIVPKDVKNESSIKLPENEHVVPTTGQLVIKDKTYDYDGGNVTILNIENQTDKDLKITITAKFLDSNGKLLKKENRVLDGFPANYRNYVVWQPFGKMKYDKFTFEVKVERYKKEAYMKYMSFSSNVKVTPGAQLADVMLGNDPILTTVITTYNMTNSHPSLDLFYNADCVVFDKYGEILWIEFNSGSHCFTSYTTRFMDRLWVIDTPWNEYKTPERIKGKCTGIVAFRRVTDTMPFQ